MTLKSGEEWAIDLAGSQFGFRDLSMRWYEYSDKRIDGEQKERHWKSHANYSFQMVEATRPSLLEIFGVIERDAIAMMFFSEHEGAILDISKIKGVIKASHDTFSKAALEVITAVWYQLPVAIGAFHDTGIMVEKRLEIVNGIVLEEAGEDVEDEKELKKHTIRLVKRDESLGVPWSHLLRDF